VDSEDLDGCINLLVPNVAKNVKCPFNQLGNDLYIVMNVFQSIDGHVSKVIEKDKDSEVDAG
jgi:hypothetical protein